MVRERPLVHQRSSMQVDATASHCSEPLSKPQACCSTLDQCIEWGRQQTAATAAHRSPPPPAVKLLLANVVNPHLIQLVWCRVRDQASKGHSILLPHVVKDALDAVAEESKQPALCDCKGAQTLATAQEVAVLGEELAFALRPSVGVWKYYQVRFSGHTPGRCAADCSRNWATNAFSRGCIVCCLAPRMLWTYGQAR